MRKGIYTNSAGLPLEIVNAILKDRYSSDEEEEFEYSATTLIAPAQLTVLRNRHEGSLAQEDIMDLFWMFLGNVAHQCLEEAWHESMGSIKEERLYCEIDGIKIAGKIDCYGNNEIRDYKFTKVYKIMKGDYSDWEKQLNIYRYLCEKNGYRVDRLRIFAFLLDWKKHDLYQKNYPENKITEIAIPLWTMDQAERYIKERIYILEACKSLSDEELPECSPNEMWWDVKDWAIMKGDMKRAYRTFESEELAISFMKEKNIESDKNYVLLKRMKERTRCLHHCQVRNICSQNKKLLKVEDQYDDIEPTF